MGRQRRRGTISKLALARQKAFGEHVNVLTPPSDSTATRTAGFAQRIFPFVRNTLIPDAPLVPSESIIGIDAEAADQIGQQSALGDWEFEMLPESILHLLFGWFNPTSWTETDVAEQTLTMTVSGGVATTTGVIAYPGQLEITPTGGSGDIEVEGFRRGSRPSGHRNRYYASEAVAGKDGEGVTTRYHYYGLTRLKLPMGVMGVTVKVKPTTKLTTFALNTMGLQFPGWTAQMLNASSPGVGFDIIPNTFAINVSNTARLVMNLIASWAVENRVVDAMDTVTRQIGTKLDGFTREGLNFFQAWGQALSVGAEGSMLSDLLTRVEANTAEVTATTDLSLAGTHNYVAPGGNTGSGFQGQPIVDEGSVGNQVTFTSTIFHATDEMGNAEVDWQQLFFNRSVFPGIIRMYNWASNGRQFIIEFQIPRIQLTSVPGLPIEGRGQTTRALAGKALPSENATAPDQLLVRVWNQTGFKEDE